MKSSRRRSSAGHSSVRVSQGPTSLQPTIRGWRASSRSSPNVNRYFDLPELVYDAYGNQVLGRLATDRPHTFKAYASYRFNYGSNSTDVGVSQLAFSGTPISTRLQYRVGGVGADTHNGGAGIEPLTQRLWPADGGYAARLPLPPIPGRWSLRVDARIGDFDKLIFETEAVTR